MALALASSLACPAAACAQHDDPGVPYDGALAAGFSLLASGYAISMATSWSAFEEDGLDAGTWEDPTRVDATCPDQAGAWALVPLVGAWVDVGIWLGCHSYSVWPNSYHTGLGSPSIVYLFLIPPAAILQTLGTLIVIGELIRAAVEDPGALTLRVLGGAPGADRGGIGLQGRF